VTENGKGQGEKENSVSATAKQVRDGGKGLKQKLLKTERAMKNILSKNISAQRNAKYRGLPGIT
jgi:hypothetical protein